MAVSEDRDVMEVIYLKWYPRRVDINPFPWAPEERKTFGYRQKGAVKTQGEAGTGNGVPWTKKRGKEQILLHHQYPERCSSQYQTSSLPKGEGDRGL